MTQVTLLAQIVANSDTVQDVDLAVQDLRGASRQEAGCVQYSVYRSDDRPEEFMIYEIWANEEALSHHKSTPHIAAFKAAVGGKASISVQRVT